MLIDPSRFARLAFVLALLCLVSTVLRLAAAEPTPEVTPTSSEIAANPAEPAELLNQPIDQPPSAGPSATPHVTRSQNVTINLINRLVERGVLTKQDAAELIQMAEEDAAAAQAEATAAAPAPTPPPDEDTIRVPYVPEVVKRQIREEIKQDVMAQA